ncbi:MAG: hypothetical protein LC732_01565, partial [Acidobacteria bacterium]|nr:hypothetical protein [Acidobacteriota bacterium]
VRRQKVEGRSKARSQKPEARSQKKRRSQKPEGRKPEEKSKAADGHPPEERLLLPFLLASGFRLLASPFLLASGFWLLALLLPSAF